MQHPALPLMVALATSSFVTAQVQRFPGPELVVNNSYRVVSSARHAGTQRNYPFAPIQPLAYIAAPGVAAGTRCWTYTPPLRVTGGSQDPYWMTVTGMNQAIHVGAAVTTFPAPNHYQFECGIGPAVVATPPQMGHAPTGADILGVATAPIAITVGGIVEHVFNLTTPIPLAPSELLFFVVYRGGEWQDDPNGGQTVGFDFMGATFTPNNLPFSGFATATQPRTITFGVDRSYRPKIGLQIAEPVLCITGDHGNGYYLPRLAGETYRGLSAAYSDHGVTTNGTFFFDISAGLAYGTGAQAIVVLNFGANSPRSIALPPLGNLLLDPMNPAFAMIVAYPVGLGALGEFNGEATPHRLPPLGPGAIGSFITGQALVFNAGRMQPKLSTKAGMQILR